MFSDTKQNGFPTAYIVESGGRSENTSSNDIEANVITFNYRFSYSAKYKLSRGAIFIVLGTCVWLQKNYKLEPDFTSACALYCWL